MAKRKKFVLHDRPPYAATHRYGVIEIHGVERLVAFKTNKVMRLAQSLTPVTQYNRVQAVDAYGAAAVAEADVTPLDAGDVTRIIGLPPVGGKIAINGCQYLTLEELSEMTGVTVRSLMLAGSSRGWPEGTVEVRRQVVPVSTETVLWAMEGMGGSVDSPDVIE
jgi:hypothetical protein